MKKIIFIEPKAPGLHIFSKARLPRLGLPLLGSILKQAGYEVKIFCEEIAPINWQDVFSADLAGISSITSTIPRAYQIVKKIKEKNKWLPVMIGGPHVTFLPEEALNQGVDYVIRGEGEKTILELVKWLEEGDEKKITSILGLSYLVGNKIFHNPTRPFLTSEELSSLPFPDLALIEGFNLKKKNAVMPVITSRGCPFNCKFCSVTKMFGHPYRFRSQESIIKEIEILAKHNPKAHFFFYDDNFTADPQRTKNLLREIKRKKLIREWSAQARIEVTKDLELLELMRDTNCVWLYLGIESVNPETLKEYRKGFKITEIEKTIKTLHNYGIRAHGMFVLGGDNDSLHTAKQTVQFSIKLKIDTVQFLILTPLPGTETFQQLENEGRLLNRDWANYDGHHVVFKPKLMSPWELQLAVMLKAMPQFYSLWRVAKKLIFSALNKKNLMNFILALYGHLTIKKWRKLNKDFFKKLKKLKPDR